MRSSEPGQAGLIAICVTIGLIGLVYLARLLV
jgi:hypothetical protein